MPFYDIDMQEFWLFTVLPGRPVLPSEHRVVSTYHTRAVEVEAHPVLKETTYDYVHTEGWEDIGLQILTAAGWRPDCAVSDSVNILKALPPRNEKGRLIIQYPTRGLGGESMPPSEDYDDWMGGCGRRTTIIVCPFFQDGFGASIAYVQRMDGVVYTQGWILGRDEYSAAPPTAVREGCVLHALALVEELLNEGGTEGGFLDVQVGDRGTIQALRRWFTRGTLCLGSAMASEIVERLNEIVPRLPVTLIMSSVPVRFLEKAGILGSNPEDIIYGTAKRMFDRVLKLGRDKWGEQIARIPRTAEETKAHLTARYRYDEALFLQRLQERGSEACRIYNHFTLNRTILRSAYRALRFNRAAQVALSSLICATRFKYYDARGELLTVKCPYCSEVDTFDHFLICRKIKQVPSGEAELTAFIRNMAYVLEPGAPALPDPIQPLTMGEIELGWLGSSDEELSL